MDDAGPSGDPRLAYVTVTDAAGRVLFRRLASAAEIDQAIRSAEEGDREGNAAMDRIEAERFYDELDEVSFE